VTWTARLTTGQTAWTPTATAKSIGAVLCYAVSTIAPAMLVMVHSMLTFWPCVSSNWQGLAFSDSAAPFGCGPCTTSLINPFVSASVFVCGIYIFLVYWKLYFLCGSWCPQGPVKRKTTVHWHNDGSWCPQGPVKSETICITCRWDKNDCSCTIDAQLSVHSSCPGSL